MKVEKAEKCHIYFMTSPINDVETREFFKSRNNFGIPKENIHFFTQGMLPALDLNGKVIMEGKSKISLAPNGNGGVFAYLLESDSRLFPEMVEYGIEYLQIIGIDNVLNKILDPVHVGLAIHKKAECVIKTLPKRGYQERVGVFAKVDGKYDLIEYSELSEDLAKKTNDKGELLFNHGIDFMNAITIIGNILNYMVSLSGLINVYKTYSNDLTKLFHIALKKVPHYSKGAMVQPTKNNGYKFELFVNGFIPYMGDRVLLYQVLREEEFAPIKNEKGNPQDSPDTARQMISELHKSWLKTAGAMVEGDGVCEIDGTITYEGEGLECYKGKILKAPIHLSK